MCDQNARRHGDDRGELHGRQPAPWAALLSGMIASPAAS